MAKPGWMGSTGTVDAGDPPEAADERCECEALIAQNEKLEAALRTANADLKAVWIETGKGLDGLKRTEVALGLTSETAGVK